MVHTSRLKGRLLSMRALSDIGFNRKANFVWLTSVLAFLVLGYPIIAVMHGESVPYRATVIVGLIAAAVVGATGSYLAGASRRLARSTLFLAGLLSAFVLFLISAIAGP